ncbi:hypothetical protein [Microbispora sp. KK1-11]|uniref:hypothetical protein n=1 Tax=Microbispora sp. KK1-11 TaxID=2053005 RepID=UPI00163D1F11|nr:hypothetical protein [Microbispora sp. KK1-11]
MNTTNTTHPMATEPIEATAHANADLDIRFTVTIKVKLALLLSAIPAIFMIWELTH